jgi:hypothetical protein
MSALTSNGGVTESAVRYLRNRKQKIKALWLTLALFPCAATLGMPVALETFTKAPAVRVTALRRTSKVPGPAGIRQAGAVWYVKRLALPLQQGKQGCNPWFPPLSRMSRDRRTSNADVTMQPGVMG